MKFLDELRTQAARNCRLNLRCAFAAMFTLLCVLSLSAQAAFILSIDTDGADDGPVTYNPGFSFGGDTTTASSSAASTAFGMTGDSIFGGDGVLEFDTYLYTYTPGSNLDNLVLGNGFDLGSGNLASGLTGGGVGTYRVYATWPFTDNVTGGLTHYTLSTAGAADVMLDIDQNGKGNEWYVLGDINFSDPLSSIVVTQTSSTNSFVSMRAAGLLFERIDGRNPPAVPEPAGFFLVLIGILGLLVNHTKLRRK
jgi:hypothetical protein